ncbi:MAG TPA: tRNA (guanosine(37)-N1)-methyltransferase TrmD [Candidatus Acidoferrales bacterium]|nr:tRNA (guanosine(37)-N1)-methyltransferase TrmD [Candidatus Acidoferrales bacterium]
MHFDLITIFPEFFTGPLDFGIVRRAREARLIETHVHDLRDFTHDRHRTVDDRPFGGGEGMVMKPEPLFEAVESLIGERHPTAPAGTAIVLLSAAGKLFRQETARRFVSLERIVLICGRYEGVDERVAEHLATDEISIGDFVLSGGELPAAMILDAVTRLIPGALGNEDSAVNESFSAFEGGDRLEQPQYRGKAVLPAGNDAARVAHESPVTSHQSRVTNHESPITSHGSRTTNYGILDYPHYTRPQSFREWDVPEVLMSGNHEEIRRWRRSQALEKTRRNRPDLLQ